MATPNPPKPPHHQVMTPGSLSNHLAALSPMPMPMPMHTAPRSVGHSPAQLAKKSPANASTLHQHNLGRSQSGGPLTYDSPTAAALGLSLNIPTLEAVASVNVRGDDEERKRRIESILGLLRNRPGRVSEEGLERLAKRTELECLWEDGPHGERTLSMAGSGLLLEVEFRDHGVTRVAISFPTSSETVSTVAPRAAKILERDLRGDGRGSPSLSRSIAPFAAHLERLAALDKLSSPPLNCYDAIAGIYTSLRRIFEWEKRKLKEIGDARRQAMSPELQETMLEREVMCMESGRPSMHAGNRLGLSLEYWMRQRCVRRSTQPSDGGDRDEHRDEGEDDLKTWAAIIECEASPAELFPSARNSTEWVSENVVRPAEQGDMLLGSTDAAVVDWLVPPPTLLPSSPVTDGHHQHQALAQSQGRLPNVRFVATLDPPVVVPLRVAYDIYSVVGLQVPQESLQHTTFDDLVLESMGVANAAGQAAVDGKASKASVQRQVMVFDAEGRPLEPRQHRYEVYVPKPDYGRVIEAIPFAHPRQLVAILPILRQYALVADVLRNTMANTKPLTSTSSGESISGSAPSLAGGKKGPPVSSLEAETAEDELVSLLSDAPMTTAAEDDRTPPPNQRLQPGPASSSTGVHVDITLSTQSPVPKLGIVFPFDGQGRPASVVFDIDMDGRIRISEQNILDDGRSANASVPANNERAKQEPTDQDVVITDNEIGEGHDIGQDDGQTEEPKTKRGSRSRAVGIEELSRAMEISEDLGIWVEFMRSRL